MLSSVLDLSGDIINGVIMVINHIVAFASSRA